MVKCIELFDQIYSVYIIQTFLPLIAFAVHFSVCLVCLSEQVHLTLAIRRASAVAQAVDRA